MKDRLKDLEEKAEKFNVYISFLITNLRTVSTQLEDLHLVVRGLVEDLQSMENESVNEKRRATPQPSPKTPCRANSSKESETFGNFD